LLIEIFQLAAMALHNSADAPDSAMSHVRDQQTSVVVTVDGPAQSIHEQFAHAFTPGTMSRLDALEINIIGHDGG
jgi:hypothetical protein